MHEFGMQNQWGGPPAGGQQQGYGAAAPSAPTPSMDWYSAGPAGYNQAQYSYAPPPSQHTATEYGSTGFEDEPPLLEELGIDIGAILQKSKAILLHQMRSPHLQVVDMGGALLFLVLFSSLHLLMGKVHFGVVLGWSVLQSTVLYFIVNQIAGSSGGGMSGGGGGAVDSDKGLDLYSCCCVTGYGLLPLILHAAVVLVIRKHHLLVGALALLVTAWSAVTAAKVLARLSPPLQEVRALVMYPCFLMYGAFALLTSY